MKSHNPVLLILLFAFLSLVAYSQTYNPNESLPFDSTYSKGTLPNGIKYIVHKLESGKKKAHIDFFYNFGSQDEKPNESGIAHLIEHLCFAGKEKYARFLKNNSVGMKYDIGATTGLGNTQFKVLDIPLTHPETIDSALNYLKELTFQLNVKEKDLAHEKKVVVEEWRLKTNIDNTVYSEGYNELMSGDLKVLKNGTLGDTAILNHFQLKDLKRFHQKWYRPENLTVIAFGDFDTTVIVQNIKKFFHFRYVYPVAVMTMIKRRS